MLHETKPETNEMDIHSAVILVASGQKEMEHYFYNCNAPSGWIKIQREGNNVRLTLDEGDDNWDSYILYNSKDIPHAYIIEQDIKEVFSEYIENDVVFGNGSHAPIRHLNRTSFWDRMRK
jgi:hypothetical protein